MGKDRGWWPCETFSPLAEILGAPTGSSVGVFENHVRRDALRHAGRRYPHRGNSKWETNVVANISSAEIPHHECFLIPLQLLKHIGVSLKALGFCRAGADRSREILLCH